MNKKKKVMEIEYKFELDTSTADKIIKETESYTKEEWKIFHEYMGVQNLPRCWFNIDWYKNEGDFIIIYKLFPSNNLQKALEEIENMRRKAFVKENEEKFLEFIKAHGRNS